MLKNLISMGVLLAIILLTLSLDVALAENKNTTMLDNITMPKTMSMPVSMPISMPMNLSEGASNNIIILQNVTLNIIMALNMPFPNDIQPASMMDYYKMTHPF
jgi:hypothetical protein